MTVRAVRRDQATEAFFEGTAQNLFSIRQCAECGSATSPRAECCSACRSTDLADVAASGRASLVSWAVTHGTAADGSVVETVLVIAELAEGPWWWSQLIGDDHRGLRVGDPLAIAFEAAEGGEAVPVFRRADRSVRGPNRG